MNLSEQFEQGVNKLMEQKEIPDLETRKEQIETLTEWYFEQSHGKKPSTIQLDRLGTYLLADIFRDKNTHKVKQEDYPALSHTQMKRRNRRERRVGDENLDFIKSKEENKNPNAFKVRTNNTDDT